MKSLTQLPSVLSMLFAMSVLVGCQGGMITAASVDAPMRKVAARHDAYVNADTKLSPLEKSVYLRDTAELTQSLDAAKPATQPVK
jgi:hypothetical protein